MFQILLSGAIGGVMRGLVGYVKYRSSYKSIPFMPGYFFSSIAISASVGLLAAWITQDLGITFLGLDTITPSLAAVIGYAGGDFIENLFKIITGKASLFNAPTGK